MSVYVQDTKSFPREVNTFFLRDMHCTNNTLTMQIAERMHCTHVQSEVLQPCGARFQCSEYCCYSSHLDRVTTHLLE